MAHIAAIIQLAASICLINVSFPDKEEFFDPVLKPAILGRDKSRHSDSAENLE